jgi:hypothetical protein
MKVNPRLPCGSCDRFGWSGCRLLGEGVGSEQQCGCQQQASPGLCRYAAWNFRGHALILLGKH